MCVKGIMMLYIVNEVHMWVSHQYIRETVMCRMLLNLGTQTIHLSLASSLLYSAK